MMDRPLPPGPVEHDEDGDPLPVPPDSSDAGQLIQLLEYARKKDFVFAGSIKVGAITIQTVRDLRQLERFKDAAGARDNAPSIWQENGVDE